jgi:hypothetical protein
MELPGQQRLVMDVPEYVDGATMNCNTIWLLLIIFFSRMER